VRGVRDCECLCVWGARHPPEHGVVGVHGAGLPRDLHDGLVQQVAVTEGGGQTSSNHLGNLGAPEVQVQAVGRPATGGDT
jgi:hypothetical protein